MGHVTDGGLEPEPVASIGTDVRERKGQVSLIFWGFFRRRAVSVGVTGGGIGAYNGPATPPF